MRGGVEIDLQHPGGLADSRRGSQQRQAPRPERKTCKDAKESIGIRGIQGSKSRHGSVQGAVNKKRL